jgi:hypothetical protein
MKLKQDAPSPEVAQDIASPGAVEPPAVKEETPPTYAKIGVTPAAICARLRILDAETGDVIPKVIEADAEAGRVVRYELDGGALVRENDRFKTIEEDRKIRIAWSTGNEKNSF